MNAGNDTMRLLYKFISGNNVEIFEIIQIKKKNNIQNSKAGVFLTDFEVKIFKGINFK